jgi:pimeloyl-ACP methyl ester carboxylesterase
MSSKHRVEKFEIPSEVNFVSQGKGSPVVMIHGLSASLHDWDYLLPEMGKAGYLGYALDLLGHGNSPKPLVRDYRLEWVFDHFLVWLKSLRLKEQVVLIGHSLGGYIALEFARRYPDKTRGLILVDPLYSLDQLPAFTRFTYENPNISGFLAHNSPEWLLRIIIDISSLSMNHRAGGLHALPKEVRSQTVLDYSRTASGVYNILNGELDLSRKLSTITMPTLVIWGDHDQTLAPKSFSKLVRLLQNVVGKPMHAGHVPHQSVADEFNGLVLEFLHSLEGH